MKKVYVLCMNHMDPLWRRCFKDHFRYEGDVIRPYVEIEEALFNQWMEILENTDCRYSIEQALTVKEYIKRNPDKLEQFKEFVKQGKIELLGGGETILDYNMVHGEAIVRSHLYSILWYRDTFERIPAVGIATDTFGLSAQLPQIYRKLGYNSLINHDRVFENVSPYWKGLNGDLIYVKQDYSDNGVVTIKESEYTKYFPCTECDGEGCMNCNYTGIDYSYKRYSLCDSLKETFKKLNESSGKEFIFAFMSEEVLENESFISILNKYGKKYEIEIAFTTYAELTDYLGKEYLEALNTNSVKEENIDLKKEGNPVYTGCYTSRIELKKRNRELEDILLSCEKMAAFAYEYGMVYPRKKIQRLWELMALIQFHDSITSTHVDAAYEELNVFCRSVKLGASQIYHDAMKTIEKQVHIPKREGYQAFVLFNPLSWEVQEQPMQVIIRQKGDSCVDAIHIEDDNGNSMEITDICQIRNVGDTSYRVEFLGAVLPPLGYRVFYYTFNGKTEKIEHTGKAYIENEYYHIEVDRYGISGIIDKIQGCKICGEGSGDIIIEEDHGSAWHTLIEPKFCESASSPPTLAHYTKSEQSVDVYIEESSIKKVIYIRGSYTHPVRKIQRLQWCQTITLLNGISKIYFKTEVDWKAENHKLMIRFPLGFKTMDDEAYYEIPYGTLKRKVYQRQFGDYSKPNGEWPALNFISCRNKAKNYCVTFINKGLPGWQVRDGVAYVSILRSPRIPVYMYADDGLRDEGVHTFEYMITSNKGSLKDGRVVQKGQEFNTVFLSCDGRQKEGELKTAHSFLGNENTSVIVSSIKLAEDNSGLVIRAYEAYGESADDSINGIGERELYEANLLEEPKKKVVKTTLRPYEIKTILAK